MDWSTFLDLFSEIRNQTRYYGFQSFDTPIMIPDKLTRGGVKCGSTSTVLRPSIGEAMFQELRQFPPKGNLQKLWDFGPVFDFDNGEVKQRTELGVEAIGIKNPQIEAEMIIMAQNIFEETGALGCSVVIDSVGCRDCMNSLSDRIEYEIDQNEGELCSDCVKDLQAGNVLNIRSCEVCHDIVSPAITDFALCHECEDHERLVQYYVSLSDIMYTLDFIRIRPGMSGVLFEIRDSSDASNVLAYGGSQEELMCSVLKEGKPCYGFSLDVESSVDLIKRAITYRKSVNDSVYVIVKDSDDETKDFAFTLCNLLRYEGFEVHRDYEGRSGASQFRQLQFSDTDCALIVDSKSAEDSEVGFYNLKSGASYRVLLETDDDWSAFIEEIASASSSNEEDDESVEIFDDCDLH